MCVPVRRLLRLAVCTAVFTASRSAAAQVSSFTACAQSALASCAAIRLTSQLGVGPGNTNLFEIAVQNLGSQATPSLATSITFLAFLSGQGPGAEVDVLVTPTAVGGASVLDASGWGLADAGDVVLLTAPANDGIGGCATSAPVGGFGQMGLTCGAGQFITFSFFTSFAYNPSEMILAGLEFVAIAEGNAVDSCNDTTPCVIEPLAAEIATPEPASMLLLLTGLSGFASVRLRRRTAAAARATIVTEG